MNAPWPERDLAVVAGEHVEAEQRDEVDGDERELRGAEVGEQAREQREHERRATANDGDADGPERPHTRLTASRPKRPDGRTSRTSEDHEQRDGQPQVGADEVDVRADEVDDHAEREPADDGAERAVDPAEHRRRERVEQDRLHQVLVEAAERRRGHHPGDGAEHGGEAPAEREHQADADADEPARGRVRPPPRAARARASCSGRTRTAAPTIAERDADDARGPGPRTRRRRSGSGRSRTGSRASAAGVPQIRRASPLSPMKQADRDDHDRQHGRVLDRPDERELERGAAGERDHEREHERRPVGHPLHQRPGDEGRQHRHLALREVDHAASRGR